LQTLVVQPFGVPITNHRPVRLVHQHEYHYMALVEYQPAADPLWPESVLPSDAASTRRS
jgi:hypothetical protein